MTSQDNSSFPLVLKTKNGFLTYTSIEVDQTQLLLTLFGQNTAKDSERSCELGQQVLYLLWNLLIFHIGVKDFDSIEGDEIARIKT